MCQKAATLPLERDKQSRPRILCSVVSLQRECVAAMYYALTLVVCAPSSKKTEPPDFELFGEVPRSFIYLLLKRGTSPSPSGPPRTEG